MSISEKPTTPAAMNARVVSARETFGSELAIFQDYKRKQALGMVGGFG
jgi:hypothetical protein